MLKTVVEHYVKHGSTVTISALDISKAFDTVDRYALLNSVNGQAAAKEFHCSVTKLAFMLCLCSLGKLVIILVFGTVSVSQGDVLSSVLFAIQFIYMDVLIVRFRSSGFGYRPNLFGVYFGCLMFADAILLLAHTVSAMRHVEDM